MHTDKVSSHGWFERNSSSNPNFIAMSPTEELIHDHDAIKVMLSIMSKIADNLKANQGFEIKDVEKIVDFLKNFVDKCHHAKEEKALFPALIGVGIPNENGPIGVMLQEHILGREYIKEIKDGIENCKVGDTCISGLIVESMTNYVTLLQNHIQKEENVLFPLAKSVLNEKKQKEISAQFKSIEIDVVGKEIHEQYHELLNQLKNKYIG